MDHVQVILAHLVLVDLLVGGGTQVGLLGVPLLVDSALQFFLAHLIEITPRVHVEDSDNGYQ